jgi:hypothetical protein
MPRVTCKMSFELSIITDLAVLLVIGSAVAFVFHKFKQPLILGYLVAGVIIGPYSPPFNLISHVEFINVFAEIGVILLLFIIGLEFPINKLKSMGKVVIGVSVIEITMMYCQCKKITETMNIELSKKDPDDAKIAKLTTAKSSLLSSISTIAKDNNIASNYNKNSKQGQSTFTSKMKEMSENKFKAIEVNLFDIKTAEAFKQIDRISNENISNQLTIDSNEYGEIIKEQREMIDYLNTSIESLKEENRILKNKIIDIENERGDIENGNL